MQDVVSRTRCGILHAAPQSRDRRSGDGTIPISTAPLARCGASGTRGLRAN